MLEFNDVRVSFTADDHFFHEGKDGRGIIQMCGRPYGSGDEMNEDLIARWNDAVAPGGVIIHLGDCCMGLPSRWPAILARLNGRKILVRGNHDRSARWYNGAFELVCSNEIVLVNGVRVWVNHYPKQDANHSQKHRRPAPPGPYDIALCGHVHNAWLQRDGVINVGVDVWNFRPVGLDELLALSRT